MQRVYENEAGLSPMILHTLPEPFDYAKDALQVAEVIFGSEGSSVFGGCQWAEGVRLTKMYQCARLPDWG
jgi:hypothetical protein